MNREMKMQQSDTQSIDSWPHGAMVAVLIAIVVSLAACSTFEGSSDGTWNTSYFTNPDRLPEGYEHYLEIERQAQDRRVGIWA